MIKIKTDFKHLTDKLDKVDAAIKDAVRPAAAAGARVLYEEILRRVPVAPGPHYDSSTKQTYPGGDLKRAVYRAFSRQNSREANGAGYSKATYHLSWNAGRGTKATHGVASHGHFMEFGHWQPFATAKDPDSGHWYTIVRPEMRGKTLPGPRASMSEKLKYFYPRPNGPQWIPPRPFLRPSYDARIQEALLEANRVMLDKVKEAL